METAKKAFKTGGEFLKQTKTYMEKMYAEYRKLQSSIANFKNTIISALTNGLKNLLSPNSETKEKAIVQDTQSSANTSVQERIERNLKYYETEKKAGYKAEYAFQKRREYIRQQANIKYLARTLVLKGQYDKIKDLVNDMTKKVDDSSRASTNQGNLEGSENKAKLLKTTAELKQIWLQLLSIQKQLEAAKLEYKANIGLSNMRPVKSVPKIESK